MSHINKSPKYRSYRPSAIHKKKKKHLKSGKISASILEKALGEGYDSGRVLAMHTTENSLRLEMWCLTSLLTTKK